MHRIQCARQVRAISTCLAVLGLAVLGFSASASAAPTVTLKGEAVPIPGFKHTGNILGAGAAFKAEYTISGTEYGGFPAPIIGIKFYGPAGAKLKPSGFKTCPTATLEAKGPKACPKGSSAGPTGSAEGVVSFGTERVPESTTIEPFFAPGGQLAFFTDGTSPVSIEIVAKGKVLSSSPGFGPTVEATVPLVESVPGALDASVKTISVQVGAAKKVGKKTNYYITVPKKCPAGGFPLKTVIEFGNVNNPKEPGEKAEAAYSAPCPKK